MAVKDDPLFSAKTMPHHAHRHAVNKLHHDEATFGEKLADRIAAGIGSWTFLIVQTVAVLCWVSANVIGFIHHWDVYPFVLLNLLFSVQAAYTGPVLLLAGNRQAQKDRLTLEHAASEADRTDTRTQQILTEIKNNTEITLRILQHLEAQMEGTSSRT
ncbi:MAG TPA: DUF1003 domain-containing protein [Candidatus Dormibacteraeota bacterium]